MLSLSACRSLLSGVSDTERSCSSSPARRSIQLIDTGVYPIISSENDSAQTDSTHAETSGKQRIIEVRAGAATSVGEVEADEGSEKRERLPCHFISVTILYFEEDRPSELAHGERQSLIDALRRGVRRAVTEKRIPEDELEGVAWIRAHLSGGSAALATFMEGSGRLLRPNDLEACWVFIERYG